VAQRISIHMLANLFNPWLRRANIDESIDHALGRKEDWIAHRSDKCGLFGSHIVMGELSFGD